MAFRGTTTMPRTRSSYSHRGAESLAPRQPKKDFVTTWYSSAFTRHAGARTSASSDSSVLENWTSTLSRMRPAVERRSLRKSALPPPWQFRTNMFRLSRSSPECGCDQFEFYSTTPDLLCQSIRRVFRLIRHNVLYLGS